jgi:gliding motility-associated-like protein
LVTVTGTIPGFATGFRWMPFNDTTSTASYTFNAQQVTSLTNFPIWVEALPQNSCVEIDTNSYSVANRPVADILGVSSPQNGVDTTVDQNSIINLFADPSDNNWSYQWRYITAVPTPNITGGKGLSYASVSFVASADTTVELLVVDETDLCSSTDTIQILVNTVPIWIMPNTFTPNGDGNNDIFGPVHASAPGTLRDDVVEKMIIYDRWGNIVFDGANTGWNGKNQSGQDMPNGTYVYYIVINSSDENNLSQQVQIAETGSITLIR